MIFSHGNVWLHINNIQCAAGSKHNINGRSGYVHSSFVSGYTVTGDTTGGGTETGGHPQTKDQAFGTSTLRYGSSGKYVKNLQLALRELNRYSGSIDGQFGAATLQAVTDFQALYWYELGGENEYDDSVVDGLVGPKTKQVLWNLKGNYLKANGYY